MPRKKKTEIKINDQDSLNELCQEIYNDACLNIIDSQKAINELSSGATPEGVDDLTKIAKEKATLLKVKDASIGKKLELAKLQSDILKKNGDVDSAIQERSGGTVTANDYKAIREMIENNKNPDSKK